MTTPCPNCAKPDGVILFEGRDLMHGLPGVFPVRRCARCGLIYISPRPSAEELASYYPDDYGPYALLDKPPAQARSRRAHMDWRIDLIEHDVPKRGRALDVGCATGDLLHGLRERGWEVSGVEPGAAAAAHARDRRGLDVRRGALQDARFPDAHFDAIIFWHALEHVPDPRETLREAARVARPGATLVISLPDPDCALARWFGPYWCGWDVPRHLCLFPRKVLAQLLEESGWSTARMETRGGRHWYVTSSLRNWARADGRVLPRMLLRAAGSAPVVALATPFYALFERLGRGPNLLAIARRKHESPVQ